MSKEFNARVVKEFGGNCDPKNENASTNKNKLENDVESDNVSEEQVLTPMVIFHDLNENNKSEASNSENVNLKKLVKPVKFLEKKEKVIVEKSNSVDQKQNHQYTNLEMVRPVKFNIKTRLNRLAMDELIRVFSTGLRFYYYETTLYVCDKNEIKEVCNFDINVTKKVIEFDGINYDVYYLIEGILNGSKRLEEIRLYPSDYKTQDWFHRMWGIDCVISANYNSISYLKEYISSKAFGIPEEIEYNFIGWTRINNKPVYLLGNCAIGEISGNVKGSSSKFILFDNKISEKDAFNHTLSMLNVGKINVTLPILSLSLLSLIVNILKEADIEPKFVMWVHGITGSRKTTITKLFCNIFGVNSEIIPASFKDTSASLEVKAFEYKDSVLIVDDYHPSVDRTEKLKMNNTAQSLIRAYGDRIGKSRMTKNMKKQNVYKPRGMCLITGEDTIDGHSSNARIMPVEILSNDIDLMQLTYFQNTRNVYTTCLYNYIKFLAYNYDAIGNTVNMNFQVKRKKITNDFHHGRLAETIAFLVMAFEIFLEYGVSINAIDKNKKDYLENMAYDVFTEIILKHNAYISSNTPEVMYLIAIQELISTNKIRLYDVGTSSSAANTVIYQDSDYLYLIPKTVQAHVNNFWSELGKSFPLGEAATIKALDKDGLILTTMEGNERKRTVRNPKIVSATSGRPRYLTINKKIMDDILSNI